MKVLDRLFGKNSDEDPHSSGGASVSEQEKILEEKKDMIQGIEDLSETSVKEVMIPRIDVDVISLEMTDEEILEQITASGHSRFPVYSGSIDNIVGVLHVKELLKIFAKHEKLDLEKILRKPFFVPESKRIDSLLREFKRRHVHIAIAIDEYGGMSGIVCMEDIIEQIVGDIQDEYDNEREDILSAGENMWICDARINIGELNEEIDADIPDEEVETLGGFVFDLFGKIPVKFEKVSWGKYDFIVQEMEGHRINSVKVIKRTGE